MKFETLLAVFSKKKHVKVFVVTDRFVVCGVASNPREVEEIVLLDLGASVRVMLGTNELLEESGRSGTLRLDPNAKVTRRLHTHRRHLVGLDVPATYLEAAASLCSG